MWQCQLPVHTVMSSFYLSYNAAAIKPPFRVEYNYLWAYVILSFFAINSSIHVLTEAYSVPKDILGRENFQLYMEDLSRDFSSFLVSCPKFRKKSRPKQAKGLSPFSWWAWIVVRRPILSTDALLKLESGNAVLNTHEKQRKMKPPAAIVRSSCGIEYELLCRWTSAAYFR